MGELLRFPIPERSAQGAERGSAPSRGPASRDAGEQTLADIERVAGPDARRRATEGEAVPDEPKWAVPGVDDGSVPVVDPPTRTARRAENVALAALTRHDASEGEVRAKLVAKELDEAEVEAELQRLRGAGLLDDAAFAERQLQRLRERKGLGDSAIRSALRGRLVPQDVIDVVLAEQAEDADEAQQRLQEVADDRARRLGGLSAEVAERRLIAYLMRKGYGGSAVRTAARAALEGGTRR